MSMFSGQSITSHEALVSTIKTDYISYGWFAALLQRPALRESLSGGEPAKKLYRDLDVSALVQKALWAVLLFGIALVAWSGPGSVLTNMLTVASSALVILHVRKRRTVAQLCDLLFARDFEAQQFESKTLYQISELYAKEQQILSLVDAVAFTDRAVWTAFLLAVFVTYFIYPLGIGAILLCVIAVVYGTRAAVNTSLVYDRLAS